MRPLLALLALLALAGCESGTALDVDITLGAEVPPAFTTEAPGVLVVSDAGGWLAAVQPLCGPTPEQPVNLRIDYGFGCLDDADVGAETTARAWVEPLPEGWDAAALCALERPNTWDGVSIGAEVTGEADIPATELLAAEPEEDWFQGQGTGTWSRDLSPCGGEVEVEITVE